MATIRLPRSQIAFPVALNLRTTKTPQPQEYAQDAVDGAATYSDEFVRAA
jgi:hypothetical protein